MTPFGSFPMASPSAWQCPVCLDTFQRPVLATCCGQSFCSDCLDAALRKVDACLMCRSPLLSGAFSATPNRSLADALTVLKVASSAPPLSGSTAKRGAGGSVAPQEDRSDLQRADQSPAASNPVVEDSTSPGAGTENGSSTLLVNGGSQRTTETYRAALAAVLDTTRSWGRARAFCCRQVHCGNVNFSVRARVLVLRRQLQQWRHWLRVHWGSIQCLFYMALFVVLVFFLRVQEEEFASGTANLRHHPHPHL